MKIETVAIVGLGALGILYGHHFTKAIGKERVRIVVNKERMARYRNKAFPSTESHAISNTSTKRMPAWHRLIWSFWP